MTPEKTQLFNRIIMVGITMVLVVLAMTPFISGGNAHTNDHDKVIVEYSISKDFYSSQGRSFVDAENLDKFVHQPKEASAQDDNQAQLSEPVSDSAQEDSSRP